MQMPMMNFRIYWKDNQHSYLITWPRDFWANLQGHSMKYLAFIYLTSVKFMSLMYLSTHWNNLLPKFLVARERDISTRQLGQVAVSSRIRASARRWVKQPAHMRCPFEHWQRILHCNAYFWYLLDLGNSKCLRVCYNYCLSKIYSFSVLKSLSTIHDVTSWKHQIALKRRL